MRRLSLTLASTLALCTTALPAQTVTQSLGTQHNAPAIGLFSTLGKNMGGMVVNGVFSDGATFTGTWADLGSGLWGVNFGGRFSVTMAADSNSWSNPFLLRVFGTSNQMTQLTFSGGNNAVVFDRSFGGATGTDSSATGKDFRYLTSTGGIATDSYNTLVTYTNAVALTGQSVVGDLFERIVIDFRMPITGTVSGRQARMNFDVDNVLSGSMLLAVPEPSPVVLLGSGMVFLGVTRTRRHRREAATDS
jgi:hypothetical protein